MSVRDKVSELAEAAKRREAKRFAQASEGLSNENRPLIIAHTAFVALHMACTIAIETLLAKSQPVTIVRGPNGFRVALNGRAVDVHHSLEWSYIRIDYLGYPGPAQWGQVWQPPNTTDLVQLNAVAEEWAVAISQHLVGPT